MAFCDDIWERVGPLRRTILEMPFNRELMDGSLPEATFQHYMLQDSLYLESYSRVLSVLSAKAREGDHMLEFSQAAQVALVVERELHEGFFEKFGLSEADIKAAEASPTTMNYCNYLIATAYGGSYAEAVAAVLPCFWVYWEVGMYIHERAQEGNPYQAWIDTYAGDEFADAVRRVIAITNEIAEQVTPEERERMAQAFIRCTQFEWMFWDAAWRREEWPVTNS